MTRRVICFVTFFVFLSLFTATSAKSIVIKDENGVYNVSGVHVEGASFDDTITVKQASISNAQLLAFGELTKFLKRENIPINENNINSAIKSFSIIDEYYNDNFYSITVDFVFDKEITKSLIDDSNIKYNDEIMDFGVVLYEKKNLLEEYARFVNFLKKENIDFLPIKITSNVIEVIVKNVSGNKIYYKLKDLKLNGKMYIDN